MANCLKCGRPAVLLAGATVVSCDCIDRVNEQDYLRREAEKALKQWHAKRQIEEQQEYMAPCDFVNWTRGYAAALDPEKWTTGNVKSILAQLAKVQA